MADNEDRIHAPLSPSSSDRWIACPGSVQAQLPFKDRDDSNIHSRLGTAAHALLELCLFTGCEPETYLGWELLKNHPIVDDPMCDAVRTALEFVEDYVDSYPSVELWSEQRVQIGSQIGVTDKDCNGTGDLLLPHADGSMLTIADYKHGTGKVGAEKNPQLMLYAAGGRAFFKHDFKKFRVVIIQPRAGKRRPVEEWTFTKGQLNTWLREEVAPSAQAALLPNPPRNAGAHCRWCKAAPTCSTYRQRARNIAVNEFDELPEPEAIDPKEIARILEEADILDNWVSSVRAHALNLALQTPHQQVIPRWELGWTRRSREWDDEAGMIEYCERKGLHLDEYLPRMLLTPAKMHELLRRRKLVPRAKKDEEKPKSPVEAFVRYSIPKPKLRRQDHDEEDEFDPI